MNPAWLLLVMILNILNMFGVDDEWRVSYAFFGMEAAACVVWILYLIAKGVGIVG